MLFVGIGGQIVILVAAIIAVRGGTWQEVNAAASTRGGITGKGIVAIVIAFVGFALSLYGSLSTYWAEQQALIDNKLARRAALMELATCWNTLVSPLDELHERATGKSLFPRTQLKTGTISSDTRDMSPKSLLQLTVPNTKSELGKTTFDAEQIRKMSASYQDGAIRFEKSLEHHSSHLSGNTIYRMQQALNNPVAVILAKAPEGLFSGTADMRSLNFQGSGVLVNEWDEFVKQLAALGEIINQEMVAATK
jgi:hypothetical protein